MGKDKMQVDEIAKALIEITSKYCDEFLDDDYKQLCIKMIEK